MRIALGRNPDGGEPGGAAPSSAGVKQLYKDDGTGTLESKPRSRIKTLDQLIAACEVDLERYRVKQHVVNKWEVGAKDDSGQIRVEELFQVKAWLEERRDVLELRALKDQLLESMAAHAPLYTKRAYPNLSGEKYTLEVAPLDLHLGKLAWGPEVNGQHYDSDIAVALLRQAIGDLLQRVQGYAIERIILVAGNDFLNSDGPENQTTAGTPMDSDSRHAKMFRRGWQLIVETIDRLQDLAPVTVKIVPGNHDEDSMFKLGEVLWAWYRNCPNVEIDNSPRIRKFFEYGPALVMLTHGSEEKLVSLPMVMANESPEAWGRTRHHEVHIGHFHKRAAIGFVGGDTIDGVVVRVLPSLCGTDEWHYRHAFWSADRAMEAYLWGSVSGYAGHLSISAQPVEGEESEEEYAA